MLYKHTGKNQLTWKTWPQFDKQFYPVRWKCFGDFSFLLDIENEHTLKNTRILFLHEIFQKTLNIPKSEFYALKSTTSIPITLLWKWSHPWQRILVNKPWSIGQANGSTLKTIVNQPWSVGQALINGFLKNHQIKKPSTIQMVVPVLHLNILAEKTLICGSGSCVIFEKPWWIRFDLWVRLKNGFLNAINDSNDCTLH